MVAGINQLITADVGYESEASFNRAFKRVTGFTPGRWREGESAMPPALKESFVASNADS